MSSSNNNKILVIGGTGGVGSLVVSQLLSFSPSPSIRVSSRDPSKLSLPSSVEVVKGDLSDPSTYPTLFQNVGKVFLYIQGTNNTLQALLTAAKEAGVHHIVFLSSSTVLIPNSPVGDQHAIVENAIKDAGFTYTFLRGNAFCTNTVKMWTPMIRFKGRVTLCYPNSHSVPVASEDIAAVAVEALTTTRLNNEAPVLTGPSSLSQFDQLSILDEVRREYERKALSWDVIDGREWKEIAARKGVFPEEILEGMIGLWKATENKSQGESGDVEKWIGRPAMGYKEWARAHAKEIF